MNHAENSEVDVIRASRFLILACLTCLFLFTSVKSEAQTVENTGIAKEKPARLLKNIDLRNITGGGFNLWEDEFTGHWAGFDAGLNTFVNRNYEGYDQPFLDNSLLQSWSFYLNPVQQSIGLQSYHNTIGLVTGLGIWWQNFRLDQNTTFEKSVTGRIEPRTLVFEDNQRSKFSMVYLILPLMAEVQIPVNHYNNRIFVSAGVTGGYRLGSHTKIVYRLDRKREKLKTPGDFSLHRFRYNLMFRAGYRNFSLFAHYDLQPLFKKTLGPELVPLSFGVNIVSF
jgi:hypothetical protein